MDLTFDLVEEQIEYLQNTVGSALYQVNQDHKSYLMTTSVIVCRL